jgi:hypothetical protein
MDPCSTVGAIYSLNLLQLHMATLSPIGLVPSCKGLFKNRAGYFSLYVSISRYEASAN